MLRATVKLATRPSRLAILRQQSDAAANGVTRAFGERSADPRSTISPAVGPIGSRDDARQLAASGAQQPADAEDLAGMKHAG